MSFGGASDNGKSITESKCIIFHDIMIGPSPAIERFNIRPYQWGTECIAGDITAGNATSFPISIGMVSEHTLDSCGQSGGVCV